MLQLFKITTRAAIGLTVLLLCGSCASHLPVRSGNYQPVSSYLAVASKVPIVLRSVGIMSAAIGTPGTLTQRASLNPLSEGELKRVEVELAASINADLRLSGLFRVPQPGERAYILDVEFPQMTMSVSPSSTLLHVLTGIFFLFPALYGLPYWIVDVNGEAVFQLYDSTGKMVHETVTSIDDWFGVGLYYGKKRPIGDVAALLVQRFKMAVRHNIDGIQAGVAVASIYGKFKRKDPYKFVENQFIVNQGPTQINTISTPSSVTVEQNNEDKKRRNVASRNK
jgi:hypothetical protein